MRLLAVCQVDRPGGPEIGLLRLLRRLEARGWEIALTSPGEEPTPLSEQGWPWEALEVGGLAHGAGARAVASWPRARRLSRDADITYLNGTVAGRLLPSLRGHATVLHVHDIVSRVPRHWNGADLVLADSRAVGGRLDPLDVHVIGCPVELDPPQAPAPWPAVGDGVPVVGFVGRLVPRKGPLELVRAAPAIRAARPDVRIVIVGDDPYEDEDPEYAAAVRAAPGVDHVGRVQEAATILSRLDVLVLPSLEEPFGTVVAEAMAAGTPVVATRVDGLPELVADGVTGALVEPGDTAALAVAVLRVLDDREAMGAAAREAAGRFGADAYADRVEDLLLELLPGRRAIERRRGLHDGTAT
ncbi:glycosyltransferase family 4 protein [Baekduia soli]|uniref:Glycosyltransferase family 4 protein n=1 Tax=Baekduia soli TaxID=496014 RepID=A0A5B8TZX3_9ACTN|nr:glycosyltransferase family 4 protein [Baekduia soli]QEC46279.1 glycosyltransferase family 4 protein [Baekduia soli]